MPSRIRRHIIHHLGSAALFASVGAVASLAQANILYGIDRPTQRLVTIDTASGAVDVIGLVADDVAIIDLAWWDGRLFGLDTNYPNGADLVEIDPETGALLTSTPVMIGGSPAINAVESLTADSTGLVVGLWNGNTSPAYSDHLGRLALDGSVTELMQYATDFDGLGIAADGSLVSIDREPGVSLVYVHEVTFGAPATLVLLESFPFSDDFNFVDDTTVIGSTLYTCDRQSHLLHRHDRATGDLIDSIPYDSDFEISLVTSRSPCAADLDGSGGVGVDDLLALLAAWGDCNACPEDLDKSGAVDVNDLLALLAAWGPCS